MHEPTTAAFERSDDRARRRVVHLAFLFYVLLLAEGPLRKWLLPGMSPALVFVRDPVMVVLLIAAARLRPTVLEQRAWIAYGLVLLAMLGCAAAQLATSTVPPLALLAGVRNYLLFVPLSWIVGANFRSADYRHWIRFNLWLAAPVGLLTVAQYRASPGAFINAAPGGEDDGVFLLVADVVRPYGLFSFTLGHSVFAAWMVGVVLAAVSAPAGLRAGWPALCGGVFGTILMGAFSGSRTFLLLVAAVLASFLGAGALSGLADVRRRAVLVGGGILVLGAATLTLTPDLATQLAERQEAAIASEGGTGARAAQVFTEFVGQLDAVPPLGYGLGLGTNIASYFSNHGADRVLAEYELTRIVQELGPFLGLAMILLRWGLVAVLTLATLRAARRGNLQPAGFLGLVAPLLLAHDITLQNSMIGIAWFAVGILVSSLRIAAPAVAPLAASRPRFSPSEARRCA